MSATATTTRSVGRTRALWTLQILLGAFMIIASAAPKFVGESSAVEMFAQIGLGQWFRYLVASLELVGGAGLLVRRVSGTAALGLVGLMIGAAYTQAFVLDGGALVVTPVLLGVLAGVVAHARRGEIREWVRRSV